MSKAFSRSECEQWVVNRNVNPRTGRKIGPTKSGRGVYHDLEKACLKKGLKKGIEVNKKSDWYGVTPLMDASMSNDLAMVKKYLRMGALPNLKDNSGWTALLYPTMDKGHAPNIKIVRELLKAGANPNLKTKEGDTILQTYISFMEDETDEDVISGYMKVINLLKKH